MAKINRALLFLCFSFILITVGFSQQASELELEINNVIWQTFKTAYEERDSEAFKAIHSKDVIRITDGGLRTAEQYFEGIDRWKQDDGQKFTIDFAFEQRFHHENVGYEVGYYRVIRLKSSGEKNTFYGRFHVVLRKEMDGWKIVQDYDTGKIGTVEIGAEFFENATFLNLN